MADVSGCVVGFGWGTWQQPDLIVGIKVRVLSCFRRRTISLSEEEGTRRTRLISLPVVCAVIETTKEVGSQLRLGEIKARAVCQAVLIFFFMAFHGTSRRDSSQCLV
jgi:hypothetical protein